MKVLALLELKKKFLNKDFNLFTIFDHFKDIEINPNKFEFLKKRFQIRKNRQKK